MSARAKYPECEKLNRLGDERGHIARFLEWCEEQRIELARMDKRGHLDPINEPGDRIIFKYLGIDPKKLEAERCAILEAAGG